MKDLAILVADKNTKFVVDGLFPRYQSLNMKQITYEIFVHPLRDPGVFHNAADFLRPLSNDYSYSLVFLDYKGSGQEGTHPQEIARGIKKDIERNGWPNRSEVIVLDPELEIWLWVDSPHTAGALGWNNYSELKGWIIEQGIWEQNNSKPKRPKEAVEMALKKNRIPRSSSIYLEVAQSVSLDRCQDKSFRELRDILKKWFPREE